MPELPEVETIRRELEREVLNRRIKQVEVTGARSVRRQASADEFTSRLEGRKITRVHRRGKYLLLGLDGGDVLVIHLGMSGQLLRAKSSREPLGRHTHVVLTFTKGGQLRYVDPRTFGELFVSAGDEVEQVADLAHLGPDPVEDVMTWSRLGQRLHARRTKLKTLLTDQRFLAGIGNLYADEILWGAGLRHDRSSETLSSQEVRRLARSIAETLQEAIKHRGSSLADEQYRDLYGEAGDYQSQHKVYGREGQPCPRCRTPVERVRGQGRSTFFCPRCQV
jgi:formamidopyrimidine-DNA glycosylase